MSNGDRRFSARIEAGADADITITRTRRTTLPTLNVIGSRLQLDF
jgi:hypothetical protein